MNICKEISIISLLFLLLLAGSLLVGYGTKEEKTSLFEDVGEGQEDYFPLEQKVGQLFMVGIEGTKPSREMEELIRELHPGGILLLKRNIKSEEQVKELISFLQKTSVESTGLPLFIAVDQEGDPVSRIEWAERTPQYQIKDPGKAFEIGRLRAEDLREMGVNLNLAPLLDGGYEKEFIFNRSFRQENRASLASALIRGQQSSEIFTCLKHFPGYDNISFNPEEKLAYVEEVPDISRFKEAAQSSPEMVMVSNVVYKEINKDLPFIFSEKSIDFLRKQFPEDIIIVSDDLSQNSLLNEFSLEEVVGFPINAGVNLLIFSGWRKPVPEGVRTLLDLARAGEISEERIDESFNKIVKLKSRLINEKN